MNLSELIQERQSIIESAGGHENLTIEQRYKIVDLSEKIAKIKQLKLEKTNNIFNFIFIKQLNYE